MPRQDSGYSWLARHPRHAADHRRLEGKSSRRRKYRHFNAAERGHRPRRHGNEEVCEELDILAEDMFGKTAVRIGHEPKRALLFKTDTTFQKLSAVFTAPNGTQHKIEILCNGQQLIVDGVHPGTGNNYRWHGDAPGPKLQRKALPLLTVEMAAQYMTAAAELMTNRGYTQLQQEKPNGNDAHHARRARPVDDPQAYALGTLENLCRNLAAMPPDSGRNAALNKGAWKMAPMVRAGWISRKEVVLALEEANAKSRRPDQCPLWPTLRTHV